MALIETTQLTKTFVRGSETIRALDGVSVRVEAGEMLSIVGPSGSGKSTLMYILGLIDAPTSGAYSLDSQPVQEIDERERARMRNQKIGFVFQSFHLLPRATALRNVSMPMIYSAGYDPEFSEEKTHRRAAEALEKVGLKERLDHLPNQLSGGQRQRVAIARALVNNPRLVFADEPTGNLDSRSGMEIMKLFEELNREGVTIVVVTHDRSIAERTSRIITLRDGAIQEDIRAT